MGVTIKDVAERSGISVVTVSKYLNGGSVRPKTAERISSAINDLGYRPNSLARGLRNSCSMTLGILVDNITNNFYTSIISCMTNSLQSKGYGCLVYEIGDISSEKMNTAMDFLAGKNIDGLFILSSKISPEQASRISETFENLVIIDNYIPGLKADSVFTDNLSAAYQATEQLLVRGHLSIAIITGYSDSFSARERLSGYLRVLQDYDLPVDEKRIFQDTYDMKGGYRAFKNLWDSTAANRPTAVLVTSYFMTVGAIIALNEIGLNIPEDISLICFDNYDINKVFRPSLSCIAQPVEDISLQAAELMLDRIYNHPADNRIIRLAPRSFEGESIRRCGNESL